MDTAKIKAILDFIRDTDIMEIEVEEEGRLVRLRRPVALRMEGSADAGVPASSEVADETVHAVKAPRVGTFYFPSRKEGESPIRKGTTLRVGQLVGYVEAMEVRQELTADRAGRVRAVMVCHGHPVEYGQTLFLIDPE